MFSHERLKVYVAEGNGRHPKGDRGRFLGIAEASAVKAAAYLDLGVRKAELKTSQRECGVRLLGRIASMLHRLSLSEEIAHGYLTSYSTKFTIMFATKELTEARKMSKLQARVSSRLLPLPQWPMENDPQLLTS